MSEISGRLGGGRNGEDSQEGEPTFEVIDEAAGRWLRRQRAGGVAVVTALVEGLFRGTTLSDWIVASVSPLQVLLSLEEENPMPVWIESTGCFALSLLPWREQYSADQFAGYAPRASSKFEGLDHFAAVTGAPILSRSTAWADCRLTEIMRTGDHLILLGSIQALGHGDGDEDDPLIYYGGRYRRLIER